MRSLLLWVPCWAGAAAGLRPEIHYKSMTAPAEHLAPSSLSTFLPEHLLGGKADVLAGGIIALVLLWCFYRAAKSHPTHDSRNEATPNFPRSDNLQDLTDRGLLNVFGFFLDGLVINRLVQVMVAPPRVAQIATPKEYDMPMYKDITFLSPDGVKISAWEIVDEANTKLVLINHPLTANRSGVKMGLDDVPVNFMPMLKHLWTNGFNIITYDHRAQGESDGGIEAMGNRRGDKDFPTGTGSIEWRDVIGALDYIEQHPILKSNELVFFGQCMGGAAMLGVWEREPERVKNVKAFLFSQVLVNFNYAARRTNFSFGKNYAVAVEQALWDRHQVLWPDPREGAKQVQCPVLVMQMEVDKYTWNPETKKNDIVQVFEAVAAEEKELLLIGPGTNVPFGTGKRFEAYNYFNDHPQQMLDFFKKHVE